MKGVSRHVFVRIVQAIIMKCLVYCFKLDEFEFNLKSKYKKYKPVISRFSRVLYAIYIYEFQIIKNPLYIKLTTILTFY